MKKLILSLSLLVFAAPVHAAGSGCSDTTGSLVLESVQAGASGSDIFGCINRSFDLLSGSVPILGTGTTAFYHALYVDELHALQAAGGITVSSPTTFGSSITLRSGIAFGCVGCITAADMADLAITTGKLADGAVMSSKLFDASVTTPKLADGSVTTSKLNVDSVRGVLQRDGNVGMGTGTAGLKPLHVQGNAGSTAVTYFTNSDAGTRLEFDFQSTTGDDWAGIRVIDSGSGRNDLLLNYDGGNVGIGTASPTSALSLAKDSEITAAGTDANDTGEICISGGGACSSTRGAGLSLNGNEDADTGILNIFAGNVSGGDLNIQTQGTTRIKVEYGGNVGIGTTNPSSLLNVNNGALTVDGGSSAEIAVDRVVDGVATVLSLKNTNTIDAGTNETIDILYTHGAVSSVAKISVGKESDYQSGGNQDSFMSFHTDRDGTLTEVIRLESGGNVGIGTTNPTGKLHVAGDTVLVGSVTLNTIAYVFPAADGSASQTLSTDGSGALSWASGSGVADGSITSSKLGDGAVMSSKIFDGAVTSSKLEFNALDASGDLVLQGSGGNVGIGVTNPTVELEIGDGTTAMDQELRIHAPTASNAILNFRKGGVAQWSIYNPATQDALRVNENGAGERLTFEAGGNIGIGTTNPFSRLDVEGNVSIGAAYSGTSAGPSNGLIIEGDVGIGITSPAEALDVVGNFKVSGSSLIYNGLTYGMPSGAPATGEFLGSADGTSLDWDTPSGAGDILEAGNNDLTGNNTFAGSSTFTARVDINAPVSLGSPTAGLTHTSPLTVWAKSVDGITQSSGCVVVIGTDIGDAEGIATFTSTTTLNFLGMVGVLFENSCVPGDFCRVAVSGMVRADTNGTVSQGDCMATNTTRCRSHSSGTTASIGSCNGHALADDIGNLGTYFLD